MWRGDLRFARTQPSWRWRTSSLGAKFPLPFWRRSRRSSWKSLRRPAGRLPRTVWTGPLGTQSLFGALCDRCFELVSGGIEHSPCCAHKKAAAEALDGVLLAAPAGHEQGGFGAAKGARTWGSAWMRCSLRCRLRLAAWGCVGGRGEDYHGGQHREGARARRAAGAAGRQDR